MDSYQGDKHHYYRGRKHCLTPRCGDELKPRRWLALCPSCRWAWGLGGLGAGIVIKVGEWLVTHFAR